MKVIFCTPTISKPTAPFLSSLKKSIPLIHKAGWEEGSVYEVGCPYISHARAKMLRKALDAKADVIVFIDHDLSWEPEDLLTLIETQGDVVAGTYRFKKDEEEYMGVLISNDNGTPIIRNDGCVLAHSVPAGFLKVTVDAVEKFMTAYPDLCYGKKHSPEVDLFNHGAHKGVWYGEDYAFSRNWRDLGGEIWLIPNLNINHHDYSRDEKSLIVEKTYKGNFHQYLLRQPGGSEFKEAE